MMVLSEICDDLVPILKLNLPVIYKYKIWLAKQSAVYLHSSDEHIIIYSIDIIRLVYIFNMFIFCLVYFMISQSYRYGDLVDVRKLQRVRVQLELGLGHAVRRRRQRRLARVRLHVVVERLSRLVRYRRVVQIQ